MLRDPEEDENAFSRLESFLRPYWPYRFPRIVRDEYARRWLGHRPDIDQRLPRHRWLDHPTVIRPDLCKRGGVVHNDLISNRILFQKFSENTAKQNFATQTNI